MWQGCQIFGFLIILVMDLLRDPNGVPANNMYRALILQAGLGGLMMILAFTFRGRMLRSEAILKLKVLNEEEKPPAMSTESDLEDITSLHNYHL
jgi:hypothetical protein